MGSIVRWALVIVFILLYYLAIGNVGFLWATLLYAVPALIFFFARERLAAWGRRFYANLLQEIAKEKERDTK